METPTFSKAAAVAPHIDAARAGRAVLAEGGNAIEAMLAMAATIAVVYPHMNGIGGDGFWTIREPGGRVRVIEACGFAGAKATIASYRDAGHEIIPRRGPLAALTAPGAIGGWIVAHDFARSLGGKLTPRALLHDAIEKARGYAQSKSEARYKHREAEQLYAAPNFAQTFFVDGKIPVAGETRRNARLADTLAHLADAGFADFYRGDVAREIAADLDRIDAPVVRDDLARCNAVLRDPLRLDLPGRTQINTPPPTVGLISLVTLGLFERLGVRRAETFEHIHGLVEASKRALALRENACVDFDCPRPDPASFLSLRFLEREAAKIDMKRAAPWPLPPEEGDTIWMGAIDEKGLAVSYIQSLFWEYGSGCVLPATGVLLQNRGVSFSLDPAHPNALAPGKKPMHTLNAPLCVFNDGCVMSYGSMGGDGQPQFQAQIFSRYMFGPGVAGAIDAPRFRFDKRWGAPRATLKLETRFDPSIVARLEAAGHEIEMTGEAYGDQFGHAGMLVRHRDGRIEAAHDPRSDGGAEGI
ncbi:MAG TPA: gamma-glutamyltransferase [Rhodoblastus sp.]|nr:gamma-glutamyltransferase [Rhodoblastus sp.]